VHRIKDNIDLRTIKTQFDFVQLNGSIKMHNKDTCGTIQNTPDLIFQRHQENSQNRRETKGKQMWEDGRDSPFYTVAKSNKNNTRK
jgi:hypothetical protein